MHKLSKYVRHAIGASQPFCQENLFSKKKTPKNSHFFVKNIGITSLWDDLEAKLDIRSIFGVALKTLG